MGPTSVIAKPELPRSVPRVRIVVPCYNEAERFSPSAFDDYLAGHDDVAFVLVNDGSTDRTLDVLGRLADRWPGRIDVVDRVRNQGKAEAVRAGVLCALAAGAEYVGYFDADLATPLEAIADFVQTLDRNRGIDIVLGARVLLLGRAIDRKPARHYLGRVFATGASLVLGLPVYDTQCGAKLFRATPAVCGIFQEPFGSRWVFDVELIARYVSGGGAPARLYELPLASWRDVGASHVKPIDFFRAGADLSTICRTYRLGGRFGAVLSLLSAPFARYLLAGIPGTFVHYLALASLVERFGANPISATAAGAIAGACANYWSDYHVAFASGLPHGRTLPRFFAIALFGAALDGLCVWWLSRRAGVGYLLAQAIATAGLLFVGYAMNRKWTFAGELPFAPPSTPSGGRRPSPVALRPHS